MSRAATTDHLQIVPVSELRSRSITWLVPQRFALGQLAIVDGDPGLGKSLILLDLAARLSTGRAWPEGGAVMEPASSIYLSAEDGAEEAITPRLKALGADLDRVFVFSSKDPLLQQPLGFPAGIDFVDAALTSTGARLVVIDPIVAFLDGGILSASDESVRRALYPLAQVAQKHDCAVILIRHLNKKSGARSLYRGGGSIGIAAACRSVWLAGPEPMPKHAAGSLAAGTRCILAQQKNNNGPLQASLVYEIVAHESGYPVVVWHGTSSCTAEELVARPGTPRLSPRSRAIRFLKAFLADGARTTREIWPAALDRGLFERTLRRAKKDLEIKSEVAWCDGSRLCYWRFNDHKLPPAAVPEVPYVEAWDKPLEELMKMYAGSTPIDDDLDCSFRPIRQSERQEPHDAKPAEVDPNVAAPPPLDTTSPSDPGAENERVPTTDSPAPSLAATILETNQVQPAPDSPDPTSAAPATEAHDPTGPAQAPSPPPKPSRGTPVLERPAGMPEWLWRVTQPCEGNNS